MDHNTGRDGYEKNVSTKQFKAQTNPWVQGPYGNEERAQGLESQARERARASGAIAPSAKSAVSSAPRGFPRTRRLTRPVQYGRVFKRAQRSSDQYFTVLARESDADESRLGLAISKRVAKQATQRNKLKRLVREVFRQHPDLPPLDFVVMAGAAAKGASNLQLRASLERHFARLAKRHRSRGHG